MADKGAKFCKGCNRVLRIDYESDWCPDCQPKQRKAVKIKVVKPEPEPVKPSGD